jgi:hypothetical protein
MEYSEFEQAVKQLIPDLSTGAVNRMFREALGRSQHQNPNALTPLAFANTVLAAQGYSSKGQLSVSPF